MKIDRAIKLLNIAKEGWPANNAEKYYKALELGIEALKRIQKNREGIFRHKHHSSSRRNRMTRYVIICAALTITIVALAIGGAIIMGVLQ